jgi:RimJ/RimL family protein N-acetyltransferase
MIVIETERLRLRRLTPEDAPFIQVLLNEPTFVRYVGDRGIRTVEDAEAFIRNVPMRLYETYGFGHFLSERKSDGTPMGICGLIKRDTLEDVDIGFSLMPEFWSKGYAYEAAAATVEYAKTTAGLPRLVAIVNPDNAASIRLIGRLGLHFERNLVMPDGHTVEVHAIDFGD